MILLRRLLSLALLGLALASSRPLRAEDAVAPFDFPTMEKAERMSQRHLEMKIMGKSAGWMTMRIGYLAEGRVLTETRSVLTVQRANEGKVETFRTVSDSLELYAADRRLIASRDVETEADVVETTEAGFGEDAVVLVEKGPGGTYTHRIELPADHGTGWRVFNELVAAWAGTELHRTYQELDEKDRQFEKNEVWLQAKTTFERNGESHPAWKLRVKDGDGVVADMLVGDDFLPFEMSAMGGVIKVTWVDQIPEETPDSGWSLSSFVDVDRAVPRAFSLESLEMDVRLDPPPTAEDAALLVDDPYQTVTRIPEGYRLVLNHGRPPKDFAPPALPVTSDDPAVKKFLAPTPQAQSDNPAIVALAEKLVKGSPDGLAATRRIVGWVWAGLQKVGGARGSATAVEVLESRRGDCTEHATLVVALCRAAGIPARNIGGLVYLVSDGKPLAGHHAWAEVWLGRWIPVDATIPEVGTSARYVRYHVSEPGEPSSPEQVVALFTRKMNLVIRAWKHFDGARVEAGAEAAEPAAAGTR